MGTVNGNVTIRVGSEDAIYLYLREDDGVTPINLAGITELKLILDNIQDDTDTKTFESPKLTVTDAAAGEIKLAQVAADFPTTKQYYYYAEFTDAASKAQKVPEDKNYIFTIFS